MTEYNLATNQPYSLRVLVVEDSAILSMELEQLISAAGMQVVGMVADAAKILPIACPWP